MLTIILIAISCIFVVALTIKHALSFRICALCVSICSTWLILLVLYRWGKFHDVVLLSLLMGQSITGIYYLVDEHVKPMLRVFTLPFFLSLTTLFYVLISGSRTLPALLVLLGLWLTAYIIFAYRNDPGKRLVTKAVINCCREK